MSAFEVSPRENAVEAGGYSKGIAYATVSDNQDPLGYGRVRLHFKWYDDSIQSAWARVAVPMAGKDRGTYFLPEVNDEVVVAFERGDLNSPCVVGAVWNGKALPPSQNTGGKNDVRMIKSRKGHILTFDDGDQGRISIELNDGKKVSIDDNGITLDDTQGNSLTITTQSGNIRIVAQGQLSLQGGTVSVQSDGDMTLQANGNLNINGTLVNIN